MAKSHRTLASPRRAVFFDLDGTLLESKLSIRDTLNQVLAERGLPPFSRADMDALIGTPLRDILGKRTSDPQVIEAMTHRYRAAYNETGWVTVSIFPGLVPLIKSLRAAGIKLAVVTSKGQQEAEILLHDLGISDLFDGVIGDDDVRALKPDPAPMHDACQLLNVTPAQAVMIGDTIFDLDSARAAGVVAIGVLWGIHSRATLLGSEPAALVSSSDELAKALKQLLQST